MLSSHDADRPVGPDWPGRGTVLAGQPRYPLVWILIIAAGSILSQGYTVGTGNHGIQLALVRHFAGDAAFDQDPLVQEMLRTYITVFYPALGYAARVIPLPWLLFAVFALLRVGTLYVGYRLSLALWHDGYAALWTSAALSVQTFTFGSVPGQAISDTYLNHGGLAQVMALAALWFLARGRIGVAIASAGLLFNVHSLHGAHLAAAMAVAVLAGRPDRNGLTKLAAGTGIAFALMVPTIYLMLDAGVIGQPDPPGWVDAVRGWVPAHYWLSSWTRADWVVFLMPWLAAVPLARLAGPACDGGVVGRVAIVALACAVAGGLVTELWDSGPLLRFQVLRWSWVTVLAGIPFLARSAVQLVRRLDRPDLPWSRMGAVLGTMMLMSLGISTVYRAAFLLTLAPAMWLMSRAPARARPATGAEWVLLAALPGLAVIMPAIMLPTVGEGIWVLTAAGAAIRRLLAIEALVGAVAVAAIVAAWLWRDAGPPTSLARRALLQSAVLVAGVHLVGRGLFTLQAGRRGPGHDWRQVQEWCAAHLPVGARVIVPLDATGLRAFSNQVPVVDFLEGAVMTVGPQHMPRYHAKLALFGYTPFRGTFAANVQNLQRLDAALTQTRVRDIARHTDARAAVRRAAYPRWDLPEAFRNDSFVIYRL